MSEDRIQQLETTVNQHSGSIQGINAALNQITETMQAFASGIVELRTSQQAVIETQRTTLEAVDRLTNTVEDYAVRSSQEIASLTAAVERLDRIVDYLIRRDSERNGN